MSAAERLCADAVTLASSAKAERPMVAYRHECALRNAPGAGVHHTSGPGKPRRQRCEFCGGELRTLAGVYGVFTWRGDGRYRLEEALGVHYSEAIANRTANRLDPNTTAVRFILTDGAL